MSSTDPKTILVSTINELLPLCSIEKTISTLTDCSPSLFILLFERLLSVSIPDLKAKKKGNLSSEERLHNTQQLVKQLKYLNPKLDINAEEIVNKNVEHLCRLIEAIKEIYVVSLNATPTPDVTRMSIVTEWCDGVIRSNPQLKEDLEIEKIRKIKGKEPATDVSIILPPTQLPRHPLKPHAFSPPKNTHEIALHTEEVSEVLNIFNNSRNKPLMESTPTQTSPSIQHTRTSDHQNQNIDNNNHLCHSNTGTNELYHPLREIQNTKHDKLTKSMTLKDKKIEKLRMKKLIEDQHRLTKCMMVGFQNKEENVLMTMFRELLKSDRARLAEEKSRLKHQIMQTNKERELTVESMEHYFHTQKALLMEEISKEQECLKLYNKGQKAALDLLQREIRSSHMNALEKHYTKVRSQEEAKFHRTCTEALIKAAGVRHC